MLPDILYVPQFKHQFIFGSVYHFKLPQHANLLIGKMANKQPLALDGSLDEGKMRQIAHNTSQHKSEPKVLQNNCLKIKYTGKPKLHRETKDVFLRNA